MVTELVAHQLSRGCPPSGSIILDELLRRYLIYIALRRFRALSVEEIKHYALFAVYRVIEKYGLEGMSVEEFWEGVKLGDAYSRALLLPDTQDGRAYHTEQAVRRENGDEAEETVILRTIKNVKTFTRRVFINLVLEDLEGEARHEELKSAVMGESAPSARRGRPGDEGQQPLDEILRHFREEREGAELEAARFVMRRVQEKMSGQQLRVVDLLLDGYPPREIAAVLEIDVGDIYNIGREYKSACRKLWHRFFGSR